MKSAPHSSLGTNLYANRYRLGFILVAVLAVYFRFFRLDSLPPGLSYGEAATATTALNIIHKAQSLTSLLSPGLGTALYNFAAAISVKLLGPSPFALRLPSAILGLAAVGMSFIWVKSWFGEKVALIAALLIAVTPWTIGLSRVAIPAAGSVVIVPLVLWLLTKAAQSKKPAYPVAAGLAIALCAAGVTGLFLVIGLALSILPLKILRTKTSQAIRRTALITIAVAFVIGAPIAYLRFRHQTVKTPTIEASSIGPGITRASQTLGMFNIRGDNDFQFNIAGTPELNLFVGLMFMVGILSCLLRGRKPRYRVLLIILVFLLIPAMLPSNAPSSLNALMAAPIVITLAALGTNYMLEVWYSTFPINSAARTLGTVPIVLLLVISAYQGYKQYFIAWAHSPETYAVYNEKASSLAGYLNRTSFNGHRYILAGAQDMEIVNFLTTGKATFTPVVASQLGNLPQTKQPQQIIFTTPQPTDILPDLKKHFPKAQLSQHFSEFNDNIQLFAVYQTKP